MLLKCYHNLHPTVEFKVGCVDKKIDENFNLNFFEQAFSTSDQQKNLSLKKLLIFKYYQIDPKEIKCPFQWWGKDEAMFPIVCFLACQILGIVGSQIEIERFFSLTCIFTNLRKIKF